MTQAESQPAFADVDANQRFESGWNRLQVATEVLVALIVVAGLLGVFGTGPLSTTAITVPGKPLVVEYERIMRRTAQAEMTIRITEPVGSPQVTVKLPGAFAETMDVVSTSPRAATMRAESDGVSYTFDLGAEQTGELVFSTKARSAGFKRLALEVLGTPVKLSLVVLP